MKQGLILCYEGMDLHQETLKKLIISGKNIRNPVVQEIDVLIDKNELKRDAILGKLKDLLNNHKFILETLIESEDKRTVTHLKRTSRRRISLKIGAQSYSRTQRMRPVPRMCNLKKQYTGSCTNPVP